MLQVGLVFLSREKIPTRPNTIRFKPCKAIFFVDKGNDPNPAQEEKQPADIGPLAKLAYWFLIRPSTSILLSVL
jgi:hypothetical protein